MEAREEELKNHQARRERPFPTESRSASKYVVTNSFPFWHSGWLMNQRETDLGL
jgi:hypothetical protein